MNNFFSSFICRTRDPWWNLSKTINHSFYWKRNSDSFR